jgi:hypothetical protein
VQLSFVPFAVRSGFADVARAVRAANIEVSVRQLHQFSTMLCHMGLHVLDFQLGHDRSFISVLCGSRTTLYRFAATHISYDHDESENVTAVTLRQLFLVVPMSDCSAGRAVAEVLPQSNGF